MGELLCIPHYPVRLGVRADHKADLVMYIVSYKDENDEWVKREFTDWDEAFDFWMSFPTDAKLEIIPDKEKTWQTKR